MGLKPQSNDKQDVSETFEAFNAVNSHNQQLLKQNTSLKTHLDQKSVQLVACKQQIISFKKQKERMSKQMIEKEKLYQQKLLDFTEFAQEQMSAQQHMLTGHPQEE